MKSRLSVPVVALSALCSINGVLASSIREDLRGYVAEDIIGYLRDNGLVVTDTFEEV